MDFETMLLLPLKANALKLSKGKIIFRNFSSFITEDLGKLSERPKTASRLLSKNSLLRPISFLSDISPLSNILGYRFKVRTFRSADLEVEGLFTTSGNLRTRKKIQSYLSRGDIYTLRNWGFEFVVECAAALKIFLQNLPQPLIPLRIQQLVVAENCGVPEKTIANDALGLLKEEVDGRHKELLLEVFTFLKEAAVKVNTSELTGCNLPLKLLPVFFDIESNDPQKFRDIATVFHEIIMEAPDHLRTSCRKIPSGDLQILERILSHDVRIPSISVDGRRSRNQSRGENAEWRIPVPRVPHTRLHPWLGRVEHSTPS